MAKIKWDETAGFLVWNRVKSLRLIQKLNQAELASGAGISIATIFNIEHGYDATTTEETKKKIADFFKVDIDDIFPAEMVGSITKEEYFRQQRMKKSRHHLLLTLLQFCPDLLFADESKAETVLQKMTTEELGELLYSGLTEEDAMEHLEKAAKKYGLTPPILKK